jgi:uncharacterized protein with PIN domain
MACGGVLQPVPKEQVRDRAPPRSFAAVDQFRECQRCGRLFWEGSHWQAIAARLGQVQADEGCSDPGGGGDRAGRE